MEQVVTIEFPKDKLLPVYIPRSGDVGGNDKQTTRLYLTSHPRSIWKGPTDMREVGVIRGGWK